MKQLLTASILSLLILSACETKKPNSRVGQYEYFATWMGRDGQKNYGIITAAITKVAKYDSSAGKDVVVIDTLCALAFTPALRDSLGKVVYDSLGMPKPGARQYTVIGKDSVNFNVGGVPIQDLIKK